MRTSVPEATVRRGLTTLGVVAFAWALVHAGLFVLALTSSGSTLGSTTEALRVTAYSSPLLAVLSFCGAALAFSGRTPTRRPGLAGAAFLVLALVCAVVVAACAVLLVRHSGRWALVWPAVNFPPAAAMAICRRLFRSAQRGRPGAGPDRTGTGPAR
jgi:hypothetical protein